jgi:hypothetical protein
MEGLDFIAGTLTLAAVWVLGNKNKNGFLLGVTSNIAWIAYALTHQHTFGIIWECLPLIFINTRNYIKWSRSSSVEYVQRPFIVNRSR